LLIGNIPDYRHFTDLVEQIYALPIEQEPLKPRSFLQKAGDLCRLYDPECFAKWVIYKASKMHRSIISADSYEENELPVGIIISDVRFVNEASKILGHPNGMVIYFDASDETRNARMMKRDGMLMTEAQSSHVSEQECDLVKGLASAIINTDNMSMEDQASQTIQIINGYINAYA